MDIGDDIDIAYYNRTGAEVIEEGFLYNLNQVVYGLSIPLTFLQKGVMNALKSCLGKLNSNVFEMMRVCEALHQKWRDGGIARQFVADDVLKYYKFKYVKDQKSGYLFSDSARPKFFDFESAGRPWCDHLVMVRSNCMQEPGEPTLELIYKNFNEKTNPKVVADTSNLFDVVSREGNELNKVLGEQGIHRKKRPNSVVEKVQRTHQNRVMATFGSAYADVMGIPACDAGTLSSLVRRPRVKRMVPPSEQTTLGVDLKAVEQEAMDLAKHDPICLNTQIRSSISQLYVTWKSSAEVLKVAAADRTKYEAEKASLAEQLKERTAPCEQLQKEKVLQKEQFEKEEALQKDQIEKEVVATKKEVEDEAKKGLSREDVDLALARKYREIIFLGDDATPVAKQSLAPSEVVCLRGKVIKLEKALSRARDFINRTQQKITPKRAKRAISTDYERQIADVIAFYGGKLERVENEFRRYISSCGKDVEVENDKGENMWFAKGNEGGGASTSKPGAEGSEEEEVEDLLHHTRHKARPQEVIIFNEPLQVDSWLNAVTVKFSGKDAKILTANNEAELWKESLKNKKLETIVVNQQVLDLLKRLKKLNWDLREARDSYQRKSDRAKTHEEACSKRDRKLNETINKCNTRIIDLDREKQALILECMQGNEVFEELHVNYKVSQRMVDAAKDGINYSKEVDKKLQRLKQKMERSVQITKQYRDSLLQEKKSLANRCKDLEDELNKVKAEFCEATLLTADNVTLCAIAMLHADLARLSYIDNLMLRVIKLLNAPSTVVDTAIPFPALLSSGTGESLNVVCPKREK
ncbi:hypothetical protein GIB67_016773 [Kingdonia uniflora]|uniref:Uncharacterized protein n=1 Tax=Kingdonia uniflora TaxID=39325 RepID=A0A7J7LXN7_9MAGN|nr:hypothetical protein GIB67_016773 [Kingdonia uniflora]